MKTHDGPHDGTHDDFGCRVKHAQFGVAAMPSRMNQVAPSVPNNSWEKGVAGETRRDGSFMPYLTTERQRMGVHEYATRRHEVKEQVNRLKSDPNVLAHERQSIS